MEIIVDALAKVATHVANVEARVAKFPIAAVVEARVCALPQHTAAGVQVAAAQEPTVRMPQALFFHARTRKVRVQAPE